MTTAAARSLFTGLVDYAGLFPPAGLSMGEAVAEYARQRKGTEAWMLGRFVVPAARLPELERVAAGLLTAMPPSAPSADTPRVGETNTLGAGGQPWALSALVGPAFSAHAEAVSAFNAGHTGRAKIEAVELKVESAAEAEAALAIVPVGLVTYVEIPHRQDPEPLLRLVRERHARAKIRTGGVVLEAIPEPARLAGFIEACASLDVPFKATAGLHHPIRGEYPLTYEEDAPRASLYGFLNVFGAAAFAHGGMKAATIETVLGETDAAAFRLDDQGLTWRDRRADTATLAAVRRELATSFGSCSFAEPVADLKALGMIS